jgi:hypothetical protein
MSAALIPGDENTPPASLYFQQLAMYFRKKLYERRRSSPEMKTPMASMHFQQLAMCFRRNVGVWGRVSTKLLPANS